MSLFENPTRSPFMSMLRYRQGQSSSSMEAFAVARNYAEDHKDKYGMPFAMAPGPGGDYWYVEAFDSAKQGKDIEDFDT